MNENTTTTTTTTYTCNVCGNVYKELTDAVTCSSLKKEIDIKVGDIIPIESRYDGIFDCTVISIKDYKHGYMFKIDRKVEMTKDGQEFDEFYEAPDELDHLNFKANYL